MAKIAERRRQAEEKLRLRRESGGSSFSSPRPIFAEPKPRYVAPKPIYIPPRPSYTPPRPSYTAPRLPAPKGVASWNSKSKGKRKGKGGNKDAPSIKSFFSKK